MAQPLAIPLAVVSPAGGGALTIQATSSGQIPNRTYNASNYQNYKYTPSPAPGYRFVRLDISGTYTYIDHNTQETTVDTVTQSYSSAIFYGGSYESGIQTTYGSPDRASHGAAYWWERFSGRYEEYLTAIVATAVFEKRNSDLLVYSEQQGGRLVYSESQNGQLVYDG